MDTVTVYITPEQEEWLGSQGIDINDVVPTKEPTLRLCTEVCRLLGIDLDEMLNNFSDVIDKLEISNSRLLRLAELILSTEDYEKIASKSVNNSSVLIKFSLMNFFLLQCVVPFQERMKSIMNTLEQETTQDHGLRSNLEE